VTEKPSGTQGHPASCLKHGNAATPRDSQQPSFPWISPPSSHPLSLTAQLLPLQIQMQQTFLPLQVVSFVLLISGELGSESSDTATLRVNDSHFGELASVRVWYVFFFHCHHLFSYDHLIGSRYNVAYIVYLSSVPDCTEWHRCRISPHRLLIVPCKL
jgi:hypothetical protein